MVTYDNSGNASGCGDHKACLCNEKRTDWNIVLEQTVVTTTVWYASVFGTLARAPFSCMIITVYDQVIYSCIKTLQLLTLSG